LGVSSLFGLFAARGFAHPAAGIVVNARGEVFFIHTGQGVCKIDAEGKLTYIHKVKGGGHFLALDPSGEFSTQFPRLFEKVALKATKPTLLYASGGAPFVVRRDGTDPRKLTHGSYVEIGQKGEGSEWSPDGRSIVFSAWRENRTSTTSSLERWTSTELSG